MEAIQQILCQVSRLNIRYNYSLLGESIHTYPIYIYYIDLVLFILFALK